MGQNLGDIYAPILEGINEDGTIILSTSNPNEWQKVGNGLPKGEMGFANSFAWDKWTFNFFLRGVWGHDLYNSYRGFYENQDASSNSWNSVITDKTEYITSTPTYNSSYIENASFIKLDNMELGYNFDVKSKNVSSFRLYLAGQNLFQITGYTGIDPEARVTDMENGNAFTTALSPGLERRNTYFQVRTFTLGATITFK